MLCCRAHRCHCVPTVGVTRDVLVDALQANLQAGATIGQHLQADRNRVEGKLCTRGVEAIWQDADKLLNTAGQASLCWQGSVSGQCSCADWLPAPKAGQVCRVALRDRAVSHRPKHLAVNCPIQGMQQPQASH